MIENVRRQAEESLVSLWESCRVRAERRREERLYKVYTVTVTPKNKTHSDDVYEIEVKALSPSDAIRKAKDDHDSFYGVDSLATFTASPATLVSRRTDA